MRGVDVLEFAIAVDPVIMLVAGISGMLLAQFLALYFASAGLNQV